MQVIEAKPPVSRGERLAVVRSATFGLLLVAGGAIAAWVIVTTPLVGAFVPEGRPTPVQALAGIAIWAVSIIAPTGLMVLGLVRLFRAWESASVLRQPGFTAMLAKTLGPEHVAIVGLMLPGGRRVNEMVLGPFGVAVLGEVPPTRESRVVGARWEVRGQGGRWFPVEAPVERTARDAERVRGWFTDDDRDFLVRVYAVVVTGDRRAERSDTCAVVPPRDLAAWLLALPVQRGLTTERRERLIATLRETARQS